MKKTYISPEAIVVSLMPVSIMAISGSDEVGSGNQLTKEYAGEDGSASGKNVWDEEW